MYSDLMRPTPPRNLYWISNKIAGSSRLRSIGEIKWLSLNSFKLIITLTEEPLSKDLISEIRNEKLHWLWEPIPDFYPPTIGQLNEILKSMIRVEERGGKVLVHCEAGLGRTGTVLACYLVLKGFSAEQAIERVRSVRPGAIESISQVIFVYNYEKLVKYQRKR